MDYNLQVARNLRTARLNAGITQEEMGKEIAPYMGRSNPVEKTQISSIERGTNRVTAAIITGYCSICNITPNEIFFSVMPDGIKEEILNQYSGDARNSYEQFINTTYGGLDENEKPQRGRPKKQSGKTQKSNYKANSDDEKLLTLIKVLQLEDEERKLGLQALLKICEEENNARAIGVNSNGCLS